MNTEHGDHNWKYVESPTTITDVRPGTLRNSFGSQWAWFGIIIAAGSAFNLVITAFSISLSAAFEKLHMGYEFVFHGLFDLFFFWFLFLPIEISVPSIVKDTCIIYLLIGGAVARSLMPIFRCFRQQPEYRWRVLDNWPSWAKRNTLPFVFHSTVFWPLYVPHIIEGPQLLNWSNAYYCLGKISANEEQIIEPMIVTYDIPDDKLFVSKIYSIPFVIFCQMVVTMVIVIVLSVVNVGLR